MTSSWTTRIRCVVAAAFIASPLSALAQSGVDIDAGGAANYSVALQVPPGKAGMAPALALSYRGAALVPGAYGYGWSMSGASVISRCAATQETDGFNAGVVGKSSDKLCLDGARLIPVDSAGGPQLGRTVLDSAGVGPGSYVEYKTQLDNYARIRGYGFADGSTAASGPAWFRIWTKDGHVADYGASPTSESNTNALITAYYPAGVTPFGTSWAIAHSADQWGNAVDYKYVQADANWGTQGSFQTGHEWNLAEIRYACDSVVCNKVIFNYEVKPFRSPQDGAETYYAGIKALSRNRLTHLTAYVNAPAGVALGAGTGAVAVRTYRLAYTNGPHTGRSRLAAIKECAGNVDSLKCFPATAFTYANGPSQAFTPSSQFNLRDVHLFAHPYEDAAKYHTSVLDHNGDGRDDLLAISKTDKTHKLYQSEGDGTFTEVSTNLTQFVLGDYSGCFNLTLADFNGDGLPDILRGARPVARDPDQQLHGPVPAICSEEPRTSKVLLNLGNGQFTAVVLPTSMEIFNWIPEDGKANGGNDFNVVDLNGDGKVDIIASNIPLYHTTLNGADRDPCLTETCNRVYMSNGDGTFTERSTNIAHMLTRLGGGLGSGPIATTYKALDFNNDGLSDFMSNWAFVGTPDNVPHVKMALSLGDGNFDVSVPLSCGAHVVFSHNASLTSCLVTGAEPSQNKLYTFDSATSASKVQNFNVLDTRLLDWHIQLFGGTFVTTLTTAHDLNGDGRDDLIVTPSDYRAETAYKNRLFVSNGDGTFTESADFFASFEGRPLHDSFGRFAFGRFTGGHELEVLSLVALPTTGLHNELYQKSTAGAPADILQTVTEPSGKTYEIKYAALHAKNSGVGSARYQTDRGTSNAAVAPLYDVAPPGVAVSTLKVDNGLGGTFSHEFSYRGYKSEIGGRGPAGFREVRRQSVGGDGKKMVTITTYLQRFPYFGRVAKQQTFLGTLDSAVPTNPLVVTANIYCDQLADAGADTIALSTGESCTHGSFFKRVYPLWTQRSGFDLDGVSPMATQTTTFAPPLPTGDPVTTIVTSVDPTRPTEVFTQTTTNTYHPDNTSCSDEVTCKWIIGRLKQTTRNATAPSAIWSASAGTSPTAQLMAGQQVQALSSVNFGTVPVGTSKNKSSTLTNSGPLDVTLTPPDASSVTGQGFTFQSTTCGSSLAVGSECKVTVRFTPNSSGVKNGKLKIQTSQGEIEGGLNGTGVELSLTDVDFGNVPAQSSALGLSTLSNPTGAALPLTVPSASSVAGTNFSFVSTTCTTSLAAGGTCTVTVKFAPTIVGARTGTLTVATGVGNLVADLTGTGTGSKASVTANTATALDVTYGGANATGVVTVKNTGNLSGTFGFSGLSGPLSLAPSSCTLAANATCNVTVTMNADTAYPNDYSQTLTVSGGTMGNVTTTVGGRSTGVHATPTKSAVMANAWKGQTAKSDTVVWRNDGNTAMSVTSLTGLAAPFSTGPLCSNVAPGANCTITVYLATTTAGYHTGALVPVGPALKSGSSNSVSGNVYEKPTLTGIAFGNVAVNGSSTLTATLSNPATNGGLVTFTPPSASSVTGTDFSFVSTTCDGTLVSGGSCTVSVKFSPTARSARTGTLTLTTVAGTLTSSLTGTGTGASLALVVTTPPPDYNAYGQSTGGVLTLTNNGNVTAAGLNVSILNEVPAGDLSVGHSAGADACVALTQLAAGDSCKYYISVSTLSKAPGEQSFTWKTSTTTPGSDPSSAQVNLSLTATGAIPVRTTTSEPNFGAVWYGATNPTITITYRNDGNAPMTIVNPNTSSPLSIKSNSCTAVAPAASCNIVVELNTLVAGLNQSQRIQTALQGAGPNVPEVTAHWSVQSRAARWGTTSLDFGDVAVNGTKTMNVTVYNDGNTAWDWATNKTLSNTPSGYTFDFSACANVAAGGSCTVPVTFKPVARQSYSGSNIHLTSVSYGVNELSVSGRGTGASLALVVTTPPPDYNAYSQSTGGVLTLTNNGNVTAAGLNVSILNEVPAGDLSVGHGAGTDACVGLTQLAAGDSCKYYISVSTLSNAPGEQSFTWKTSTTTPGSDPSSAQVNLSLTAGTAVPRLTTTSEPNFGSVWYGSTAPTLTMVYRNDGNVPMTLYSGSDALGAPLSVASSTCNDVAPAASCNYVVRLATNQPGLDQMYRYIQPVVVGAGANAQPLATAHWSTMTRVARWGVASLAFGTVGIDSSKTLTVALHNDGNTAFNWSTNNALSNTPAGYSFNFSACSNVAAGGSCTVQVTFTPQAAQAYNGSNIYLTSVSYGSDALSVSGTGVAAPAVALTNHNVFASAMNLTGTGSASAQATLTMLNTGTLRWQRSVNPGTDTNGLYSGEWLLSGAPANYEVLATKLAGTGTGTFGTWVNLGSSIGWMASAELSCPGNIGDSAMSSLSMRLDIRKTGTTEVLASATQSLTANAGCDQ